MDGRLEIRGHFVERSCFMREAMLGRGKGQRVAMASIDDAMARLDTAMALLEASVTRRLEADDKSSDRETELALMQEDRARLADELDAASARLARMTATTDDVEHRLDRVIGTVQGVLHRRPRDEQG